MSWVSDNPELYDELLKQEVIERIEKAFGVNNVNHLADIIYELDNVYDWMGKAFGTKFALDVAAEAEANYWSGMIDHCYEQLKEARYG
mgnify:CR=1 FL=1